MMKSASAWNTPLTIHEGSTRKSTAQDNLPARDKPSTSKTDHDSSENGGVWLFVDNSNIWIETKKAKKGNLDSCFSEDPRVRIDVGRLADLISRGRRVNHGTLYGSEPPPIDTVWKKIQEKGFEVKKYKRSTYTNKEKKIDTQIVADVTELVVNPQNQKYGSTIIIVSGDSDMSPCIEKAVKHDWRVEVWGMTKGMSGDLKTLQKRFPAKVEVNLLTKRADEFTFTNERYPINDTNRNELHARGIVLQGCSRQLKKTSTKEWKALKVILNDLNWPWTYAWLVDKYSYQVTGRSLLILLLPDPSNQKTGDALITKYRPILEKHCKGIHCRRVDSFFTYFHRKQSRGDKEICIANIDDEIKTDDFGDDDDDDDDDSEDNMEGAAADIHSVTAKTTIYSRNTIGENNWKDIPNTETCLNDAEPVHVSQSSMDRFDSDAELMSDSVEEFQQVHCKVRKKHQKYSIQCPYHYQCNNGRKCTHSHTEEQKMFFDAREEYVRDKNKDKLYGYKTVMCNKAVLGSHCKYGKHCYFAHDEKEQVCCKCHMRGHPTNECPGPQ